MYDIKQTIKDLLYNYSIWTDSTKCQNLETLYRNKLIKLTDEQLIKISLSIGYKFDKQVNKQKICETIVNHFKKRVALLQYINENIEKCADMISRAKNGPICKNVNAYVDDFFKCNTIPQALWIDKEEYREIINRKKSTDRIESLIGWVDDLEEHYNKSLKRLLKIIKLIRNEIDNTVTPSDFDAIEQYTRKIVDNMNRFCETYYLLAINSS
jgi:hypothetical protein